MFTNLCAPIDGRNDLFFCALATAPRYLFIARKILGHKMIRFREGNTQKHGQENEGDDEMNVI